MVGMPHLTANQAPDSQFNGPARCGSCRERRGLQQVAAGRRFPVQHFAGDKNAGKRRIMKPASISSKAIAGGRDRARDRRDAGELNGTALIRLARSAGDNDESEMPDALAPPSRPIATGDRMRGLAQEIRQRLFAVRRRAARSGLSSRDRAAKRSCSVACPCHDRLAQVRRQRIDRAALDAACG